MSCRYTLRTSDAQIKTHFNLKAGVLLKPRFNIHPTEEVPIVCNYTYILQFFKWGLVPAWAKSVDVKSGLFNLKLNHALEKKGFLKLLKQKRALLPADGLYFWKKVGQHMQPFFVQLKTQQLFSIACVWDEWLTPQGHVVKSFAMLTQDLNKKASNFQGTFPVILNQHYEQEWLHKKKLELSEQTILNKTLNWDLFICYPVSTKMNSPNFDVKECIMPLS